MFSQYISRAPSNIRAASTRAPLRGLGAILQQNPDDVVITFARRTAIGKAKKGQLKDVPVDEMLQALFKVRAYRVATLLV
jgi:acetyl-CoA acyltransferase 1